MRIQVPPEAERKWAYSLGYLIWSMGQVEWQCYAWGQNIGGTKLRDKLTNFRKFGRRVDHLKEVIISEDWKPARIGEALDMWDTAKRFSDIRNIVAHNPVISYENNPTEFFVCDAKDLVGDGPRAHIAYGHADVYSAAKDIQDLARSLSVFWAKP